MYAYMPIHGPPGGKRGKDTRRDVGAAGKLRAGTYIYRYIYACMCIYIYNKIYICYILLFGVMFLQDVSYFVIFILIEQLPLQYVCQHIVPLPAWQPFSVESQKT
jgi:hypothetical protein